MSSHFCTPGTLHVIVNPAFVCTGGVAAIARHVRMRHGEQQHVKQLFSNLFTGLEKQNVFA